AAIISGHSQPAGGDTRNSGRLGVRRGLAGAGGDRRIRFRDGSLPRRDSRSGVYFAPNRRGRLLWAVSLRVSVAIPRADSVTRARPPPEPSTGGHSRCSKGPIARTPLR